MKDLKNSGWIVIDGGSVKDQEEGVVAGLGVVFGSPNQPDRSKERDFFTPESHISRKESFEVPLYYKHSIGDIEDEIGDAVLTKEENGWRAVAQIDLNSEAGKKAYEYVKSKPHGFSSGSMPHLVRREQKENNTNWLKRFPVGELSLTPRPAEPRAIASYVKSLDGDIVYTDAFQDEVTWENMVKQLEQVLSFIKANTGKAPTVTEDFEVRFEKKISDLLKDTLKGNIDTKELDEQIAELKSQLEAKETELADLNTKFTTSEDALTKANERIAQLEILSGAKEFLDKRKGTK